MLAASSLTEAFADLAREFERMHPDIDVGISTAGSQALRLQVEQGMAADLFASAHVEHILALAEQGEIAEQTVFAHAQLAIAVPADNPARVRSVADLVRVERLVIGASTVPIGRYTREFLQRARGAHGPDFARQVLARVVSQEHNVRLVRAKVAIGEADAAVVYDTDVDPVMGADVTDWRGGRVGRTGAHLQAVAIPPEFNQTVDFRIARLTDAPESEHAQLFLHFLASETARAILQAHGFTSP